MKKAIRCVLCLGLVAVITLTSSCVTQKSSSQNTSSETYRFAAYKAVLENSMFDTDKAVRAMAVRYKFMEVARYNKYNHMEFVYRDFNDNKLTITLTALGPEQTRIEIKVGQFGDKRYSQDILVAIDEELRSAE